MEERIAGKGWKERVGEEENGRWGEGGSEFRHSN